MMNWGGRGGRLNWADQRLKVAGLAIAAATMLVAACGSSGKPAASQTGATSGTAATSGTGATSQTGSTQPAASGSAKTKSIKIAAIEPLSGAFASDGDDDLLGEKFAVQQINASGGIASLGGAHLELVTGDAGGTPAQATATAETVLSQSGISAATGSWYSSLTEADSAVGEEHHIPWITDSGTDTTIQKGFQYIFKTSSPQAVATTALQYLIQHYFTKPGHVPVVAFAGDNNVGNQATIKEYGTWEKEGILKIGTKEIWTPPLPDATPVAAAVVHSNPDVIVLSATSTTDETEMLQALASLGNKAPIIGTAASWDNPSYLTTIGAKAMNGVVTPASLPYPGKGAEAVIAAYQKFSGQPWMDAEASGAYIDVEILAQAINEARSSNPMAIMQELHSMQLTNFAPIAGMFPGDDNVSFAKNGQRNGGSFMLVEWINGKPLDIYPTTFAQASPTFQ